MTEIPEYIQDIINSTPRLKKEELNKLLKQYRITKDQKIKEKIANSYLWLVVKIAKRFYRKYKNTSLELSDLIEEGIIGLLKAIHRHKVSTTTSFRKYAEYWIKQSIQMFLKEEKPFAVTEIPSSLIKTFKKWFKVYDKILKETGKKPSLSELAKILKISYKKARKIAHQVNILSAAESLATPVGDDATIEDFIEDNSLKPEEILSIISFYETLEEVINKLFNKKEIFIIRHRFLPQEETDKLSYRRIAKVLHVSPEYVRQMEKQILNKLTAYVKYKLYA
jgi:RNA polymerase primary sigma factor